MTLTRQQNEMIFSLIFFFFASFLFITIITSSAIANFDNLLPIMLKPNGFFVTLGRIFLVLGFLIALISLFVDKSHKKSRRYINFTLFGAFMFMALFALSIATNLSGDELEKMINIYSYKESSQIVADAKKIIIDSIVFVYFILMPLISFFYKQRIYDSYFYQTYLREIAPSLNTSVIFLFGYSIESYGINTRSHIDLALSVICILLFLRMAFSLRHTISFYAVMNMLVLIVGFALFLIYNDALSKGNLYYVGIFFYIIGLLYWYLNISIKLKS